MRAYEVWAGWVGKGLCMELQAALQSDAALTSSIPLQAWEETIIAQVLPLKLPLVPSSVWPSHLGVWAVVQPLPLCLGPPLHS